MLLRECSLAVLAFALSTSLTGCGGTVKNDQHSSAGSTSAGAPSSAGAAPSGGGNGSGGRSMGVGGSSGAGTTGDICELPWVDSSCNAAIPKYWHNRVSGMCERRTYGGCGGNANLFDTFEECTTTCKPSGDPHTACNEPTDCELRSPSCCADCEPIDASSLIAVNHSAPSPICTVLCGACPAVTPNQSTSRYFIPGCVEHRCTVIDIRETSLTECATNSDCALRNTAACCERCGIAGDPIAYNRNIDPAATFCAGEPVACPACVGGIPEGFVSQCLAGRCVVDQLVR